MISNSVGEKRRWPKTSKPQKGSPCELLQVQTAALSTGWTLSSAPAPNSVLTGNSKKLSSEMHNRWPPLIHPKSARLPGVEYQMPNIQPAAIDPPLASPSVQPGI